MHGARQPLRDVKCSAAADLLARWADTLPDPCPCIVSLYRLLCDPHILWEAKCCISVSTDEPPPPKHPIAHHHPDQSPGPSCPSSKSSFRSSLLTLPSFEAKARCTSQSAGLPKFPLAVLVLLPCCDSLGHSAPLGCWCSSRATEVGAGNAASPPWSRLQNLEHRLASGATERLSSDCRHPAADACHEPPPTAAT